MIMILVSNYAWGQNPEPGEEETAALEKKLRHKKIIISATRTESQLADSPVQIEVISKEDIRNRGARTVSDVLNNQTGFLIQRSTVSGDNVQIQGLDSTYLLIMRDGERLNGRINGGQYDLSRLRVENIERIEIVRGSSSSIYGSDAIAGVINIVTRQPDKPRAEGRVQGGNMGSFDAAGAVSFPLGKFGVKGAGGYRTQQPFKYDKNSAETDGRGIVDYSGEGGVEYNFSEHWVAALQGDYQRRRLWGTDAPDTGGVFDRTNLTETAQVAFRVHTRRNGETLSADGTERDDAKIRKELHQNYSKADYRLNGSYTSFRDQFAYDQKGDIAADKYEQTRENTYVSHAQASIPVLDALRLTAGAEGFFENITTPRIQDVSNGGSSFVARHRLSGYTQADVRFWESLIITPGVRYDRDSQFGDYVSPRIGAKWGTEDFIIRASAGMGYRAPSFRELYLYFENPASGYIVNGNKALKAESSKSANLGIEAYLTKRLSLDNNAYFNDLTNLIQAQTTNVVSGTTFYEYQNVAKAFTTGIDNRLTYYLNRYLRVTLGYSFTYAYDREKNRLLDGRSLHRGTLGLLFRYKQLMVRVQSAYIDRRIYYRDQNGNDLTQPIYAPGYVALDANIEYRLGAGFSIYAGGDNLTSAGDKNYMPLPPARVFGGVRYIFGD